MDKDEALKLALEAHQAMREWIDAVPDDTMLPAMPGCDRDWLDTVEANLKKARALDKKAEEHMIYRTFEQWKSGNVLEHGVPRTEYYSEDQLDLVEMGWNYGYDAGRAVEQALDKMADNARDLGLDYEPAPKQRWAVFCRFCNKEWSVSYKHPGKSVCVDCDDAPPAQPAPVQGPDWKAEYLKSVESGCITLDELREARAELDATNRQVEILSDALAESRREVVVLKAVHVPHKSLSDHLAQATNGRVYVDPVTGDVGIGTPAAQQEPMEVDQATMELAESVGLIGPASRTHDLHAAIQRFHDLICVNATIKAAKMAADAIRESTPPAAAPVEDVDWKEQYEKQKRRSDMWVAKYEKDIGPIEYAAPAAAQPAPVPDAIHHTDLSESLEYIQGWNECRQTMLEMMK